MLRENIPLETIARITELSISQLEGFANEQLQQLRSRSVGSAESTDNTDRS